MTRHRLGFMTLGSAAIALAVGPFVLTFGVGHTLRSGPGPVDDPDRVVVIVARGVELSGTRDTAVLVNARVSGPVQFSDLPVFERAAYQGVTSGAYADYRPRIRLEALSRSPDALAVSWQYFSLLGLSIRGRDFTADDDRNGAPPVAILSDRLWREAFGRRADVIGRVVDASPVPVRIIGVAPAGFQGVRLGERVDMWIPMYVLPHVTGPLRFDDYLGAFQVLARLRSGATLEDVEDVLTITRGGSTVDYDAVPITRVFGSPHHKTASIEADIVLRALPLLAVLCLMAGCGALAAFAVMHYDARRQELGVRRALGCSLPRLVMLIARETSLVLVGGVAGSVALVALGLRVIPAVPLPNGVDLGRLDFEVDWTLLVLAGALALIVALLALALPLVRAARPTLVSELLSRGYSTTASPRIVERSVLVAQAAFAIVLVVAAGLSLRTVVHTITEGPGFNVARTLFVEVRLPQPAVAQMVGAEFVDTPSGRMVVGGQYTELRPEAATRAARIREALDRLGGLPGVRRVALGRAPIGLDQAALLNGTWPITIGGEARRFSYGTYRTSPEYLEALGVRVRAGDWAGLRESPSAAPRAVAVTASFAEHVWPGQWPVGRTSDEFVVRAVVDDLAQGSLRSGERRGIFWLTDVLQVSEQDSLNLTVGTHGDAVSLVPAVHDVMAEMFPQAADLRVSTGRDVMARDLGRERLAAWFLSGLGAVVLVLAGGSIAGTVRHIARSRRREIGIRLALGASPRRLLVSTMATAIAPVGIGVACGLLGATLLSRAAASSLLGLNPFDPLVYVSAVLVVAAAASLAALLPALSVRTISPSQVLRAE